MDRQDTCKLRIEDFEICDCPCHSGDPVRTEHCMPCCEICPTCGQNIKTHHIATHIPRCEAEKEKQVANIRKPPDENDFCHDSGHDHTVDYECPNDSSCMFCTICSRYIKGSEYPKHRQRHEDNGDIQRINDTIKKLWMFLVTYFRSNQLLSRYENCPDLHRNGFLN